MLMLHHTHNRRVRRAATQIRPKGLLSAWMNQRPSIACSTHSGCRSKGFPNAKGRLFLIDDTGGLVPVVQKVPLEKHDREEEAEPENSGGEDECEEVVGFELRAGVLDGVADPAHAHT
jgi:hypothetical protein